MQSKIKYNKTHKPTINRQRKENPIRSKKKVTLPFNDVVILGDSHVRHVAAFVKDLIQPSVEVSGICKPGAKLQDVLASSRQPTTGTRCEVIIAGTNDIATGDKKSTYHQLESCITTRPTNVLRVVSTLPHHHDLPPLHSVNEEIALVNSYIEDLALRHDM